MTRASVACRAMLRAGVLCTLLGAAACATLPQSVGAGEDAQLLDLRLADATLRAGAPDTALHVSEEMLQRNPRDAQALLRRGQALLALDRPQDAAESFAAAYALLPGSMEALAGLARARTGSGDAAGAEQAWRRALARAPSDWRAQAGLAIALDMQARHQAAQQLYRAALALAPDDAALRSDLGLSLALSGQAAAALPLLREAAQGGGGETAERARHNLAVGLVLAGDEADARTVLDQDLPPRAAALALAGLRQLALSQ